MSLVSDDCLNSNPPVPPQQFGYADGTLLYSTEHYPTYGASNWSNGFPQDVPQRSLPPREDHQIPQPQSLPVPQYFHTHHPQPGMYVVMF